MKLRLVQLTLVFYAALALAGGAHGSPSRTSISPHAGRARLPARCSAIASARAPMPRSRRSPIGGTSLSAILRASKELRLCCAVPRNHMGRKHVSRRRVQPAPAPRRLSDRAARNCQRRSSSKTAARQPSAQPCHSCPCATQHASDIRARACISTLPQGVLPFLMHDLPNVVPVFKASDEVHPLRRAL